MPNGFGYVMKGVGGLYTVRLLPAGADAVPPSYQPQPLDGCTVSARGRGTLRRGDGLLVGDLVEVEYDERSFHLSGGVAAPVDDGAGIVISRVLPRRTSLIRPPMANLDVLFITLAAASPEPDLGTVDKLICIAVHNGISPVVVINKCDLDPAAADRLADVYRRVGIPVFSVAGKTGEGVPELTDYINNTLRGRLAAFAGASGVGKSTLLGRIFPSVNFATGEISQRIKRGKNTTRHVEIVPLSTGADCGYLADTPGFTMIDFERFDFFALKDLLATFPEFAPFTGTCRYADCTHTKEQECECAVRAAVASGKIPASRHRAYVTLYDILKRKERKY